MRRLVSYFAVLVVGLFAFVGITKAEKIGNVDLKGSQVIYIGRDGCGYCQAFVPGLKYLSEKYNFKYVYVNTDKTTETELSSWLKKLNVKEEEFGTPTFGVLNNGTLKESHVGYIPEEELFTFLQKNGIIPSNKKYESKYKYLKSITNDEYIKLVESGKKSIVVFSTVTNLQGIKSKDMLDKVSKESGVDIYFYNLGFNTEEEFNKFLATSKFMEKNIDVLSLPAAMIVEGTEIKDLTTFMEEENFKKFITGRFENVTYTTVIEASKWQIITIVILSVLLVASLIVNVMYMFGLPKKLISKKAVNAPALKETVKEVKKEEVKKVEPKKEVKNKTTKTVTKKPTTKKPTTKKPTTKKPTTKKTTTKSTKKK